MVRSPTPLVESLNKVIKIIFRVFLSMECDTWVENERQFNAVGELVFARENSEVSLKKWVFIDVWSE